MKLFLDCEFTSFQGQLISIALVSEDDNVFYEVVPYNKDRCHPWVVDNVLPILNKDWIFYEDMQIELRKYLNHWQEVEIIADWPEDFVHFFNALLTGPGNMINVISKITTTFERRLDYKSLVPHNALEDARAIKAAYFKKYTV
jgi:hypothetical protein